MSVNNNIFDIRKTPIVKLLVPYIAGVIVGLSRSLNVDFPILLTSLLFVFLGYLLSFFLFNKGRAQKKVHFFMLMLFFFVFGIINAKRNQFEQNQFKGYQDKLEEVEAYVMEEGKETSRFMKYVVMLEVGTVKDTAVKLQEKIYLYIQKTEDVSRRLHYGDRISFKANFSTIPPPYNTGEFDYRQFSYRRGISFQQFIKQNECQPLPGKGGNFVVRKARELRRSIVNQYKKYIQNPASVEIVSALVLGYRTELSPETFDLFSNTGTIHILSVSGMHVGMIFAIILFVFYPFPKRIRLLLSLLFIWAYAVFAGLAPSVMRATIMITLYVLGQVTYNKSNTMNILSITAFVLLLLKPAYLFEVGFQLSFMAVIGILWIYPLCKRLYYPTFKLTQRFADVLYISIAAQIFTAPLTLFYFNYFPSFFLLANILVVFPASLLMALGLILPMLPFPIIKVGVGKILLLITQGIWTGLDFIYNLPFSIISGIFISGVILFLLYVLLISGFISFYLPTKKNVFVFLILVLCFSIYRMNEKIHSLQKEELRIYNLGRNMAISVQQKGQVKLFTDQEKNTPSLLSYSIYPFLERYTRTSEIKPILLEKKNIRMKLNKCLMMICQKPSLTIGAEMQNTNLVLVRHNAVEEFPVNEKNESMFQKVLFVFDASNTDFYIQSAVRKLDEYHIPYYVLKNNNAYVWKD